jgi:hypothetical protein
MFSYFARSSARILKGFLSSLSLVPGAEESGLVIGKVLAMAAMARPKRSLREELTKPITLYLK